MLNLAGRRKEIQCLHGFQGAGLEPRIYTHPLLFCFLFVVTLQDCLKSYGQEDDNSNETISPLTAQIFRLTRDYPQIYSRVTRFIYVDFLISRLSRAVVRITMIYY